MNQCHGPIVTGLVWPGDWVLLRLIVATSCSEYLVYLYIVEYNGSTMTGIRIRTLVRHRFPFSMHDVLYLTTPECLRQLATSPKVSGRAIPTLMYWLMRRREGRQLHVSALQPSPSNACQI